MLQSFRLWLLSTALSSLLRVPKSLWAGLLKQIRVLDSQPLTNDQKQAAAEEWLVDSARGMMGTLSGLATAFDLLSAGVIRRAVQAAVITVRIEALLFKPSNTVP